LNKDLEKKTADIQNEFDAILNEMLNNRDKKDVNGFYCVMKEVYGKGPDDERHSSPTMRLIA
jgi:hypothetical protein